MEPDSLQSWRKKEISEFLDRSGVIRPRFVWCDPHREWLDLPRVAWQADGLEVWTPPIGSADERRWCREGKLPQPGWWPEGERVKEEG